MVDRLEIIENGSGDFECAMNWNECYEIGNTPWEKGFATPVIEEIHKRHPELFQGNVLVPGCGMGHDARRLAELGMQVTAIDLVPLAIERAKQLDPKGTVKFVQADVFHLPDQWRGKFDAVWEHTCFCALPPERRKDYISAMTSALKPGGKIFGVFFINPEMDEGETGPPFGIEVDELHHLWESVGMKWQNSWVPKSGYEGRIGRELAVVRVRVEG